VIASIITSGSVPALSCSPDSFFFSRSRAASAALFVKTVFESP
jgi:hypothetical protein